MLAQQSPRFICRGCLSAQTRLARYRRLAQVRQQSTDSSQKTDAPNTENPPQRIPLRELLERRKLESQAAAEPVKESTTAKNVNVPQVRPRKFSLDFFRRTIMPKEPPPSDATKTTSNATPQPNSTDQQPSNGEPASTTPPESTPSSETKARLPDLIQSNRSKQLEKPDIPLPSAPTTRLRSKYIRPRRVLHSPDAVSPLSRVRVYQAVQTVGEPKIHPGDPIYTPTAFPGTAVREIITEQPEVGDLDHRERIWSEDIKMTPIQPKEFRPVPTLEHGLDRVLFKYPLL
jgi:hypothetical protein